MILPGKHLRPERSLVLLGAEILPLLEEPLGVSELWMRFQRRRQDRAEAPSPFDWFVLCLSFLFAIGTLELDRGSCTGGRRDDPQRGQTSIVELVHFMLGAKADKGTLLRHPEIASASFFCHAGCLWRGGHFSWTLRASR